MKQETVVFHLGLNGDVACYVFVMPFSKGYACSCGKRSTGTRIKLLSSQEKLFKRLLCLQKSSLLPQPKNKNDPQNIPHQLQGVLDQEKKAKSYWSPTGGDFAVLCTCLLTL